MPQTPIYMDHHATTPVDERVLEAMLPYYGDRFGNAASRVHAHGAAAKEAVEAARGELARLLGASPDDLVFTSGATESDNLAIAGTARGRVSEGKHIVTVSTEHRAVLDTCRALEQEGWLITRLEVDGAGRLAPDAVAGALRDDTVLVSVMLANNEIGVAHDLAAIGASTRPRGIAFHCDAAQGLGYLPLSVRDMHIDLASVSAHKMYGPKGVGALYIDRALRGRGLPLAQIHGGGHEGGFRSGTLDVPGIVGLGAAAELMRSEGKAEARRIAHLRDTLERRLVESIPEARVNGAEAPRHPGNLNMSFGYVDGAALLMRLCEVASVSSGAACSSAKAGPSHVLGAMGVPDDWAAASVRFGLGRHSTEAEVQQVADATIAIVDELRARSALWKAKKRGKRIDW